MRGHHSVAESFTLRGRLATYLALGGRSTGPDAAAGGRAPAVGANATLTIRRMPDKGLRVVVGVVTLALGALALSAALSRTDREGATHRLSHVANVATGSPMAYGSVKLAPGVALHRSSY